MPHERVARRRARSHIVGPLRATAGPCQRCPVAKLQLHGNGGVGAVEGDASPFPNAKGHVMRAISTITAAVAAATAPVALAQDAPAGIKPATILQETVTGMPTGAEQEVRILTATIKPGDKTVHHTHPFPVTVHILEGTFTLEMDGHEPVTLGAGDSYVEPANTPMVGSNQSDRDVKALVFFVSDPGTPFLVPTT